jgi:hypothetical protein
MLRLCRSEVKGEVLSQPAEDGGPASERLLGNPQQLSTVRQPIMNCTICGLFFSAVERVAFRTHKRFHGAFVLLEAEEAEQAQVPLTQTSPANTTGGSKPIWSSQESSSASFGSSR